MKCPSEKTLFLAKGHGLSEEQAAEVLEHAKSCHTCHGQLLDFEQAISKIQKSSPDYSDQGRRNRIRSRILQADTKKIEKKAFIFLMFQRPARLAIAAFATILVVMIVGSFLLGKWNQKPGVNDGFVARGTAEQPSKWVGLRVYRLGADNKEPKPIKDHMFASDRLLFSYVSLAPKGYGWLTIVAKDASGSLRWYHPQKPETFNDVASIKIDPHTSGTEIKEAVAFDLPEGPMVLVAIFSHRPLTRADIEQSFATAPFVAPTDTAHYQMKVLVVPAK